METDIRAKVVIFLEEGELEKVGELREKDEPDSETATIIYVAQAELYGTNFSAKTSRSVCTTFHRTRQVTLLEWGLLDVFLLRVRVSEVTQSHLSLLEKDICSARDSNRNTRLRNLEPKNHFKFPCAHITNLRLCVKYSEKGFDRSPFRK